MLLTRQFFLLNTLRVSNSHHSHYEFSSNKWFLVENKLEGSLVKGSTRLPGWTDSLVSLSIVCYLSLLSGFLFCACTQEFLIILRYFSATHSPCWQDESHWILIDLHSGTVISFNLIGAEEYRVTYKLLGVWVFILIPLQLEPCLFPFHLLYLEEFILLSS